MAIQHFPIKNTGKIINYFANFLSQNFWDKTQGRETAYDVEIFRF